MSVEVHRAGRTYYPHHAVLLNVPSGDLTSFLETPEWQAVSAAMFLGMPEVEGRRLSEFSRVARAARPPAALALSAEQRARLQSGGFSSAIIEDFERMQRLLHSDNASGDGSGVPSLREALVSRTAVPWSIWERAGQELLEAVMPVQAATTVALVGSGMSGEARARDGAARLGLSAVTLATDFPITSATFGFSRMDYQPGACRLNPFPAEADHGGKFPIFVDVIEADAILLQLDHALVLEWLAANGVKPQIPTGTSPELSSKSFFIQLMDGISPTTLTGGSARMVFGLLHTLSHLAIRKASLMCGLDRTSLSEYVLPRTLSVGIYCNHRFGATIGALTALFEQTLPEWFSEMRATRRCVYDPVCQHEGGTCHACTHLPETSCRFFNLNLSRSFLFGGSDLVAGEIKVGFVDFVAARDV